MSTPMNKTTIPQPVMWVAASHGRIPVGAIPFGKDANGEVVYVGRVFLENAVYVGKVASHLGSCRVPMATPGMEELRMNHYEVLTLQQGYSFEQVLEWVEVEAGCTEMSQMLLPAGRDQQGKGLYVAKTHLPHADVIRPCGESGLGVDMPKFTVLALRVINA